MTRGNLSDLERFIETVPGRICGRRLDAITFDTSVHGEGIRFSPFFLFRSQSSHIIPHSSSSSSLIYFFVLQIRDKCARCRKGILTVLLPFFCISRILSLFLIDLPSIRDAGERSGPNCHPKCDSFILSDASSATDHIPIEARFILSIST